MLHKVVLDFIFVFVCNCIFKYAWLLYDHLLYIMLFKLRVIVCLNTIGFIIIIYCLYFYFLCESKSDKG